jgi:hypothetical protein
MPTVIDSLVVELGLDAQGYQKGQAEAISALDKTRRFSEETSKKMVEDGKRAAGFFDVVKASALSLVGVVFGAGGLAAALSSTSNNLVALAQQSRLIGESAQGVEAFAMAIYRAGGNADSARGMLQKFSEAQTQWGLYGKGNFGPMMDLIGGDLNTKPLEAMKLFQGYIEKHKDTANGIQKISAIGRDVFGFDQATINAMIQMGTLAKLNAEIGKSYALGVPTKEEIDRIGAFQGALRSLEQVASSTGRAMMNDLAPGLTKASNALTEMIEKHPEQAKEVLELAGALTTLGAVRLTAGKMGLTGVAAALDSILLAGLGIAGLSFLLKSDTDPKASPDGFWKGWTPDNGDPDPYHQGSSHGLRSEAAMDAERSGSWLRRHLPTWLGGSPGYSSADPRGIRNNNPLNLEYRPDQGAVGSDGRFGVYATPADGVAAAERQLLRYQDQGDNTIRKIISRWAPASDGNDTEGYIRDVAGQTGFDANSPLNLRDPDQAQRLIAAMARRETGRAIDTRAIQTGVDAGLNVRPGPQSRAQPGQGNSSVTIGSITVNTKATDAKGIARDIGGAIVQQANRGLV